MNVGIGGLVAAMSTKPGPSSALATNVANALSWARLALTVCSLFEELVVAVGGDLELAAVDPAGRVHVVEVRLDAVDVRAVASRRGSSVLEVMIGDVDAGVGDALHPSDRDVLLQVGARHLGDGGCRRRCRRRRSPAGFDEVALPQATASRPSKTARGQQFVNASVPPWVRAGRA